MQTPGSDIEIRATRTAVGGEWTEGLTPTCTIYAADMSIFASGSMTEIAEVPGLYEFIYSGDGDNDPSVGNYSAIVEFSAGERLHIPIEIKNLWTYELEPGTEPLPVPLPETTDQALIYFDCFEPALQTPLAAITPELRIIRAPHIVGGKAASVEILQGTYNPATGRWSALIAPGAYVSVKIPEVGLYKTGYICAALSSIRADSLLPAPPGQPD